MKCPHCLISFHEDEAVRNLTDDCDFFWTAQYQICPACKKIIVCLKGKSSFGVKKFLVYPKGISRAPLSQDVPDDFSQDYKEACLVINDSPKASAALSRRCLQNIIRGVAGVKKSDLNKEIEELLDTKSLPTRLADSVDAIRVLGNFAAHPIKSTNTGEIVDVEPGEAEWLLDVLEGLFDFYFVQPAELGRKRDQLNKKLADAGKPPIK
ncbi:MAG: DUF4145 domain-containing protein [Candidatus Omnitrophica bacterium]|nr:DUF4145 domain-containing protein [Candidatus Omnitrophota bacterium]